MTIPAYDAPPTVYRSHGMNCSAASHRTWAAIGKCLWPGATWVLGEGRWVTVSRCKSTTAWMHRTEAEARGAMAMINATGCGGRCRRSHQLVLLADHLAPTGTR